MPRPPFPPGQAARVVVLVKSGPGTPEACATPFFMASAAAALEHEAEMVFQVEGVRLMVKGVADRLTAAEEGKPVAGFIREAKALGVRMRCCSGSLAARGLSQADLIPECDGLIGGAQIIELSLSADLVLCY
jgi:predicted peroxiredoxin